MSHVIHDDKCKVCGVGNATIPTGFDDLGGLEVQLYICEPCAREAAESAHRHEEMMDDEAPDEDESHEQRL